jgi:hypothetical protein
VLTDFTISLRWWVILLILGWAGWPFAKIWFKKWENHGYLLAKAVGLLLVTYGVWILGSFRILPFGWLSIFILVAFLSAIGWLGLNARIKDNKNKLDRAGDRGNVLFGGIAVLGLYKSS